MTSECGVGSSTFDFSSGVWTPQRPSIDSILPKYVVLVPFLSELWARKDARHISASRLRFFLASINCTSFKRLNEARIFPHLGP